MNVPKIARDALLLQSAMSVSKVTALKTHNVQDVPQIAIYVAFLLHVTSVHSDIIYSKPSALMFVLHQHSQQLMESAKVLLLREFFENNF